MSSWGLILLLGAAASALPADIPAEGEVVFTCNLHPEHEITIKDRKSPIYLCNSEEGGHLIFASSSTDGLEKTFKTSMPKSQTVKLQELHTVITGETPRHKRSPQFGGFGFGGSGSNAQSSSFSQGAGGGGGGYRPGGGFGGGASASQASASSGSFGGGYDGFYG